MLLRWMCVSGKLPNPAVLVSEDDYNSWQETIYLLRSPANAAWLASSIAQAEASETEEHELFE
jgi:antitoxin YefM